LPLPIRDAMQDGISPLCPLKVLAALRVERRRCGETEAIAILLRRIETAVARPHHRPEER
jgi:hypothetical protein